jgi:two-component system sensor histidine kinase DegS
MTTEGTKVPEPEIPSELDTAIGDTFLRRAQEILALQLNQLRDLAENIGRLSEEVNQERRNLSIDREEVNYRLRFLDEKNDSALKKSGSKAQEKQRQLILEKEKQRHSLHEQQTRLEARDKYLDRTLLDVEDTSRRINLLVRQLEIAGSQLQREEPPGNGEGANKVSENPWEVALRAQLIQGHEEERKRLAREIHDGPAQVLASAAMQLDWVGQLFQKERPNAVSELNALRVVMRESLAEVRRFMFNLQPKMLADQGLGPTLQHYCTDFAHQYNLQVEINLPDLNGVLNPNQALAAFRVVQEALQNVRKHAEATKIVVSGSRTPEGKVMLSVTDDGRGFNPSEKEQNITHGAGLPGMQERAELVGGKLKISSRPGYGTEVTLII